jgi:hypothetical protein
MTDQELYQAVHNELFKTGSCKTNIWFTLKIVNGEKVALFEAMQPTKGNIKIRKPFKKQGVNGFGEQVYLYKLYKFTNKGELKDVGIMEGLRSEVEEIA